MGAVLLVTLLAVLLALWRLVWLPSAVARSFARQGIRGPAYRFPVGSMLEGKRIVEAVRRGVSHLDSGSHDIIPVVLPQCHKWVKEYGKTFVHWIGPIPALFSTDLQLIKQVLSDRTGVFQKDFMIPVMKMFLGNGLILINGDDWKRHRKVVLPAINHEKIKSMKVVTAEATEQMMQLWRDKIEQSGDRHAAEMYVDCSMDDLTKEVFGRVAFGTSHAEADEITRLLRELQKLSAAAMLDAPIHWYLPTRRNLQVRRVNKLLRSKIMGLIQTRVATKDAKCVRDSSGYGDDLLGVMLEACSPERQGSGEMLTFQDVIEECKTFFIAGMETTAALLTWMMFLLAVHPQWQDKVREEVLREFTGDKAAEVLDKLKLLHMVVLETLRLYPPVMYIQRTAASDVEFGGIKVPRGTVISIPIGMLHRDKEVWGPDADEFNPMRFVNGLSRAAKDPNPLLSFSQGPRICAGQRFSLIEAEIVMAMILRKFSFSLSPEYVHKPKFVITLMPKSGVPLILRNLDEQERTA